MHVCIHTFLSRWSLGVPIGPIDAQWCGERDGTGFGSYRDRPAKKSPNPILESGKSPRGVCLGTFPKSGLGFFVAGRSRYHPKLVSSRSPHHGASIGPMGTPKLPRAALIAPNTYFDRYGGPFPFQNRVWAFLLQDDPDIIQN